MPRRNESCKAPQGTPAPVLSRGSRRPPLVPCPPSHPPTHPPLKLIVSTRGIFSRANCSTAKAREGARMKGHAGHEHAATAVIGTEGSAARWDDTASPAGPVRPAASTTPAGGGGLLPLTCSLSSSLSIRMTRSAPFTNAQCAVSMPTAGRGRGEVHVRGRIRRAATRAWTPCMLRARWHIVLPVRARLHSRSGTCGRRPAHLGQTPRWPLGHRAPPPPSRSRATRWAGCRTAV